MKLTHWKAAIMAAWIIGTLTLFGCAKELDEPSPSDTATECPTYEYRPDGRTYPKPYGDCQRVGVQGLAKLSTVALFVDGSLWLQVLDGDTLFDQMQLVPVGSVVVYTVETVGTYTVRAGGNAVELLGDSEGEIVVE